jgi:hypothetical protein
MGRRYEQAKAMNSEEPYHNAIKGLEILLDSIRSNAR